MVHNLEKITLLCLSHFKKMLRNLSKGIRLLLSPFSLLYYAVTSLRNYGYDAGLKKTYQSATFSINVGNLTVGGTGKTPHIEYIATLLKPLYTLAILSRGYGRNSKGYLKASSQSSAAEIGDEPLQIYRRFGQQIPVYVCEKRAVGLQRIQQEKPSPQIILLDDAFQHRAITPHLNLLLSDYGRLFYQDFLLPSGLLRESRAAAKRADAVIITKCPTILEATQKTLITASVKHYAGSDTPVFFSTFEYGLPTAYLPNALSASDFPRQFWLVSGIAQPHIFEEAAKAHFQILGHTAFGDHHSFSNDDLHEIIKQGYPILTTEKDWVKLQPLVENKKTEAAKFFYWPIKVKFDTSDFDNFILSEAARQFHV